MFALTSTNHPYLNPYSVIGISGSKDGDEGCSKFLDAFQLFMLKDLFSRSAEMRILDKRFL
jgi:hypothetical protein